MPKPRHAEIAGAGFGGLVAAVALAERGWTVRVHERTPILRAEGFAIAMQPNMLKVVESLGVRHEVLRGGLRILRREREGAAAHLYHLFGEDSNTRRCHCVLCVRGRIPSPHGEKYRRKSRRGRQGEASS